MIQTLGLVNFRGSADCRTDWQSVKDSFPWLNMRDISRLRAMDQLGILDFLRQNGKIVLVPTSQKRDAKKLCDRLILFERKKVSYR